MDAKVKVVNLARLYLKVERMAKLDLTPAVGKAVAYVQGEAKNLVPVDTGGLRGSIMKEVKRSADGSVQGRVFTNFEYAPYVEFGTGAKGDGTYPFSPKGVDLSYRQTPWSFEKDGERIWTNGQIAQPFMYPAMKRNERQVRSILKDEYHKILINSVKG